MKLAVVGGGSTYTPELLSGLIERYSEFPLRELWLMDVDEHRLQIVGGFCERLAAAQGAQFAIYLTTNRKEALAGADFVITQIRVGGQQARHQDILLGLRQDIVGQETTGVGGFAKAMRTIPVILDICEDIKREAAPGCILLNFTNPCAIITQAVSDYTSVPVIGLCNVPITMMMKISEILQVPVEELTFDYVGLNHLGWIRHVYHRGEDKIKDILDYWGRNPASLQISNVPVYTGNLSSLAMIPSPYLRYFYFTKSIVKELKEKPRTRAEEVKEIEEKLLQLYARPDLSAIPAELEQR